jgi:hypothetical protein
VFDRVAWQNARNGDDLPVYFFIPPPSDAAKLNDVQDIPVFRALAAILPGLARLRLTYSRLPPRPAVLLSSSRGAKNDENFY